MNEIKSIHTKIKALLNSDSVSNYMIFKETGVSQGYLSDLKKGNKNIDNMKLKTAGKLIDYYDAKQKGLTD